MRLAKKKAIVTAAASGMGQAGCEAFAREGATVVAIDIDAGRLKTVVDQINASGGKAHGIVADLLDAAACRSSIEEAARWMGGIDVLWAHAGMPGLREVENLNIAAYDEAMDRLNNLQRLVGKRDDISVTYEPALKAMAKLAP